MEQLITLTERSEITFVDVPGQPDQIGLVIQQNEVVIRAEGFYVGGVATIALSQPVLDYIYIDQARREGRTTEPLPELPPASGPIADVDLFLSYQIAKL